MSRWPVLLVALMLFDPGFDPARAASEPLPRIYQEEFHLRADRRFSLPGWREIDPGAAELIVQSGCRALGTDCSEEPEGREASGRFLKPMIASDTYRGTAWLLRVRRGSYYAKFVAPRGYSVCRAGIYLKGGRISGQARFAGSIQRSGLDGVGIYADLGPVVGGGAEFRLLILYVARQALAARRCWPDQTILFLCRDGECRASRAYPETDLR